MISQLATESEAYICLAANDPAQSYGSLLPHVQGISFLRIPSTAVVLCGGRPVLIAERQGAKLTFCDDKPLAALECLVTAFRQSRIWPKKIRISVKNPAQELAAILMGAGFSRSMQDFVLYRNP